MSRIIVQKRKTGARWASADPSSGVWQKVWAGVQETKGTQRVGFVAQNFHPLTGRRHMEFEVLQSS
ncbi:hypothetical protein pphageT12_05 [Pseudomonas phage pphageT12]|uniref:Uncharacterized protein n=1 Tax=Pseudomonas phage phiB1_1 TaxID=2755402 RepID=A0A7D7J432_9CAUD|nr:hypothetical protein phiB1_1_04 [Pseudomonas phage phiB1_1]UAW53638.1 hypothetical protein pphageB21_05 [Pseudomonas phage pphageB21]UAW53697.1 hypothetical protein pphageT21_05 [Pseudomonas phage pphageT21]UAW53756.1 hypothetical protein pphageT12_05 [Pseudomonas phage pphageT12]UAW53817.1 hypothetical protein pphageBV72_05 [Pseudomonas phage pphageBV72]